MFKKIFKQVPGFRTGVWWKMLLAVIGYLILITFLFQLNGFTVGDKIISFFENVLFIVPLFILLTNVAGIRDKLPIFNKGQLKYTIIGVVVTYTFIFIVIGIITQFRSPQLKEANRVEMQQKQKVEQRKVYEAAYNNELASKKQSELAAQNKKVQAIREAEQAVSSFTKITNTFNTIVTAYNSGVSDYSNGLIGSTDLYNKVDHLNSLSLNLFNDCQNLEVTEQYKQYKESMIMSASYLQNSLKDINQYLDDNKVSTLANSKNELQKAIQGSNLVTIGVTKQALSDGYNSKQ